MNVRSMSKIDRIATVLSDWGLFPAQRESEVTVQLRPQTFNLSRRFAVASFFVIVSVTLGMSVVLAHFLSEEMLKHDAIESSEFIHRVLGHQFNENFFSGDPAAAKASGAQESLSAVAKMPGVLRAQAFSVKGTVLWSSHDASNHHTFGANPELERALKGEVVVEADLIESRAYIKPEHVFAAIPQKQFAEYYLPVWDEKRTRVIGVVEIYKSPEALFDTIRRGLQLIWITALCGGLLMYACLFWTVRRAHQVMLDQQQRIASNEGFAAVGEMAAAVAHNLRNPMAAIRSSAELMAGQPGDRRYDFAGDIMAEIDRMESWIRALLGHAKVGTRAASSVSVNTILKNLIDGMHAETVQRRVLVQWFPDERLKPLYIDGLMLVQIAHTVVANALDAMPDGGTLTLTTRHIDAGTMVGRIEIVITDTGVGIPAQKLKQTFTAPASTKTHGLGIGLPLVQRTVERMGGALTISSQPGFGTRVTVSVPQN
jgi:signal transduction histidine kinase